MSVEDHSLRAIGHSHRADAVREQYQSRVFQTIAMKVLMSLFFSCAVTGVLMLDGVPFDPRIFTLASLTAIVVGLGIDAVRYSWNSGWAYYHASAGQLPHMIN